MSKRNRNEPGPQPDVAPPEAYGEYQYASQPQQEETAAAVSRAKQTHKRKKTSLFFRFLILMTIVTVLIVVAQKMFFSLETVYVIGCEHKTPQQVVLASGLVRGQNMIGITEEDVAQTMLKDHTIIFKDMQKKYPGTIYLYVEERQTTAVMQWLGVLYTLDGQGMVMTEETSSVLPTNMPLVTGFRPNSVMEGQFLKLRDNRQLEAYQTIVEELKQQMYSDQITAINLADINNMYLVTLEGVTVRLGSVEHMRDKIGAVRTCMGHLRQLNVTGGILDVTKVTDLENTKNEVKYMPEGG